MLKRFFSVCLAVFFASSSFALAATSSLASTAQLAATGSGTAQPMTDDPTIGGRGLG